MKICTWNVNSIKARLPNVENFLKEENPDIALLQELKCVEENFPKLEIEELGYNCEIFGQKTYNGVAILSKHPIDEVTRGIPEFDDDKARYIEAIISHNNGAVRVASVYVPNGQQIGSEKFKYKMDFFEALNTHLNNIKNYDEPIIIGGDFNVAPEDIDVYDPKSLKGTVCFHPDEQAKFRKIINSGYIETYRALNPTTEEFSWWDYRGNGWQYNKGLRIDFLLSNPKAFDQVKSSEILTRTRGEQKASDHAPVIAEYNFE